MDGRVVHFEIPYDDQDRARRFYGEAFGWTFDRYEDMHYLMARTGPSPEGPPTEPGYVNGGLIERGLPFDAPIVVLQVDDLDAALEKVAALGGETVTGRHEVSQVGFAAYVRDTEGNLLGLWQFREQG